MNQNFFEVVLFSSHAKWPRREIFFPQCVVLLFHSDSRKPAAFVLAQTQTWRVLSLIRCHIILFLSCGLQSNKRLFCFAIFSYKTNILFRACCEGLPFIPSDSLSCGQLSGVPLHSVGDPFPHKSPRPRFLLAALFVHFVTEDSLCEVL